MRIPSIACVVALSAELASGARAFGATPDAARAARAEAIENLRRFVGTKRLDLSSAGGDEHVARHLARAFAASRARALVALAWAGDPDACDQVEKLLKTEPAKRDPFLRSAFRIEFGTWPAEAALLVRALEHGRPALAEKLRREIVGTRLPVRTGARIRPRPGVDELSLEKVIAIAKSEARPPAEVRDAMRRWAVTSPEAAEPWLIGLLEDEGATASRRCAAAHALVATAWERAYRRGGPRRRWAPGEGEALAYLESACLGNLGLGGMPATYLLEAGGKGTARYFRLLSKHDGEELPYPFVYSIKECDAAIFLEHLDRFLTVGSAKGLGAAYYRLSTVRLSKGAAARIVDHLVEGRFDAERPVPAFLSSLRRYLPPEADARALVAAWVDSMQREENAAHWREVAAFYLDTKLGTPELVARAARRAIRQAALVPLACDVLAETGKSEDAPAIAEAVRAAPGPTAATREAWLARESWTVQTKGWLAVVRLTSHLARPAMPEGKQ